MTDSFLLSGSRGRRSGAVIHAAILVSVGTWALGCSDVPVVPVVPRAGSVFTSVLIKTRTNHDSITVGQQLSLEVQARDQYGGSMVVDAVDERMSDPTIASIVSMPGGPWDYGNADYIVGAKPGDVVLTVTASLDGVSHSATRPITVLPPP